MAEEGFDEAEAAALQQLKTSFEQFAIEQKRNIDEVALEQKRNMNELKRLIEQLSNGPTSTCTVARINPVAENELSGLFAHQVLEEMPKSLDKTQIVAKESSNIGAHKVFDETPTLVNNNEIELIDELLDVLKVEGTQTVVNDADESTKGLLIVAILDKAEERAAVKMNNESIVVKQPLMFTARQVFDRMPKSMISSEIKLLGEWTKKTEVLAKKELGLGSVLVSSYESKVFKVCKVETELLDELELKIGHEGALCFDPGGGSLKLVGDSLDRRCCEKEVIREIYLCEVCLSSSGIDVHQYTLHASKSGQAKVRILLFDPGGGALLLDGSYHDLGAVFAEKRVGKSAHVELSGNTVLLQAYWSGDDVYQSYFLALIPHKVKCTVASLFRPFRSFVIFAFDPRGLLLVPVVSWFLAGLGETHLCSQIAFDDFIASLISWQLRLEHHFTEVIMPHNIQSRVLKLFVLIPFLKESMASLIELNGPVWNDPAKTEKEFKFFYIGIDCCGARTLVFDPGGYLAEVLLSSQYDMGCCCCPNLARRINEICEAFLLQVIEGAAVCELLKLFDIKGKFIFEYLEDEALARRRCSRQYKRLTAPLPIDFPHILASVLSFERLPVIFLQVYLALECLGGETSRVCSDGGDGYKDAYQMEALLSDSAIWALKLLISSFAFVDILIFDPGGEWLMQVRIIHKWKGSCVTVLVYSSPFLSILLTWVGACVEFKVFDPGGKLVTEVLMPTPLYGFAFLFDADFYGCSKTLKG